MKIIKKVENTLPMDSFNDSMKNLPCYGVSVQARYSRYDEFTIKGIDGLTFAKEIMPSSLALNINIHNNKKLKYADYKKISKTLAQLKEVPLIILSSSQLSRHNLNEFRKIIIEEGGLLLPKILVASNDDMSYNQSENGDMIYSSKLKSQNDYEFDRLASYVDSEVPVLLDCQNNNDNRISKMIERTNGSDDLIVLSKKPKTTRRIMNNL